MKIELKEITIKELINGYQDNQEGGVIGYGGKLDIRPAYQREFVYKEKQRDAVIDTINQNFPLNVMYWAVREDGNYEIIDGQQRTISICQYATLGFSYKDRYFNNLQKDEREKFSNYKIMVYFCEGSDSEKLQWFETINIAGEKLTPQELRNAVYSGSWVTDAKRYFSRSNCQAHNIAGKYLKGSSIRQEYLETAIKWISNGKIAEYMGKHQHDENAEELWNYFQKVIDWVKKNFTEYRSEMKGIKWGELYNEHKNKNLNPEEISKKIAELMEDKEVTSKKGIYQYILTGKEKYLNLRTFSPEQKRESYEKQNGICPLCKGGENESKKWEITEMEADHITPWSEGGATDNENCQLLCKTCNREKSNK